MEHFIHFLQQTTMQCLEYKHLNQYLNASIGPDDSCRSLGTREGQNKEELVDINKDCDGPRWPVSGIGVSYSFIHKCHDVCMIQNKKHEVQELSKRMKETIKRIQVTVHMMIILLTAACPRTVLALSGWCSTPRTGSPSGPLWTTPRPPSTRTSCPTSPPPPGAGNKHSRSLNFHNHGDSRAFSGLKGILAISAFTF